MFCTVVNLDTMIVIYTVQNTVPYVSQIDPYLSESNINTVVSELTRLECRMQPIREQKSELLRAFDSYFDLIVHEVIPLTREVIDEATTIRATYTFKTPDAIYLAAAVVANCDVFFTHDLKLARFEDLTVRTLSQ